MKEATTNEQPEKPQAHRAHHECAVLHRADLPDLSVHAAHLVDLPFQPDVERRAVQVAACLLPAALAVLELRQHAGILQVLDLSEEHDDHHRPVCHLRHHHGHDVRLRLRAPALPPAELPVHAVRRLHAAADHGHAHPAVHHVDEVLQHVQHVLAAHPAVSLRRRRVQHLPHPPVRPLHPA